MMGIDYNIYVGPYIDCVPTMGEVTEEYRGCPKCEKPRYDGSFCPKCGVALTTLRKRKNGFLVRNQDVYSALVKAGLDEDDIFNVGDNDDFRYLPNSKDMPGKHIDPRSDYGEILTDENLDIAADKATIANALEPHLKVLRDLFGPEHVSIKWGVLSYTS